MNVRYDCVVADLIGVAPLLIVALVLLVLKRVLLQPRLAARGDPVPGVSRLGALLIEGTYRGVAVHEETLEAFGGGRYLPRLGQIRLGAGMLARADVDAYVVLEHERGHAERDLPAPRSYRLALVGAFLAALALGITRPELVGPAGLVMSVAFAVAALHHLRNELAATEYALRQIGPLGWPPELLRQARTRLAASFALYLADWSIYAGAAVTLVAFLRCR